MGFFAKLPFFEGWTYNLIKLIYLNSFLVKYHKNEKVFSEGDEPSNVYLVTQGEFMVNNKIMLFFDCNFGFFERFKRNWRKILKNMISSASRKQMFLLT